MFSPFDGKNKPLLNSGYYHSNYKDMDSPGEGACVRAQGQGLRAGSSHDRLVSRRAGWKVLPHGGLFRQWSGDWHREMGRLKHTARMFGDSAPPSLLQALGGQGCLASSCSPGCQHSGLSRCL